jgi:hypothetical protein
VIRRTILATCLAVAACMIALLPSAPADAYSRCLGNSYCGWIFYSDPQHTQWVGSHTTNCEGTVLNLGVQQGYSVYVTGPCNEV